MLFVMSFLASFLTISNCSAGIVIAAKEHKSHNFSILKNELNILLSRKSVLKKCSKKHFNYKYECYGKSVYKTNKRIFTSDNIYEGEYRNNKRHGIGKYTDYYSNVYEGEWKNSQKNGLGAFKGINNDFYIGEWKDDYYDGFGIYIYPNGDSYEGYWLEGKIEGIGKFYYANGTSKYGYWKSGKLEKRLVDKDFVYRAEKKIEDYASSWTDNYICTMGKDKYGDWRIDSAGKNFVLEAKRRGLSCNFKYNPKKPFQGIGSLQNENVNHTKISNELLCRFATDPSGSHWALFERDIRFVKEAKKRGLNCGVNGNGKTSIATNQSKNPTNRPLATVSDSTVCYNATKTSGGSKIWNTKNDNFVGEANYRGLDCGVKDSGSKVVLKKIKQVKNQIFQYDINNINNWSDVKICSFITKFSGKHIYSERILKKAKMYAKNWNLDCIKAEETL
ncbi:hypothetical protein N8870_07910, partial [Alphaproteobacteria bacterium]|nr:hypothetical protein [Alphaproteobacteria bacterium]